MKPEFEDLQENCMNSFGPVALGAPRRCCANLGSTVCSESTCPIWRKWMEEEEKEGGGK